MITCSNCSGSSEDPVEIGVELQPELDLVAEEAADALLHPGQQVVELQDLGVEHLAAAEGEELAGEGGAPLADLLDLPQVLAGRLVAGQPGAGPARSRRRWR